MKVPNIQANAILKKFGSEMRKHWVKEPVWYQAVVQTPPTFQFQKRIVPGYEKAVAKWQATGHKSQCGSNGKVRANMFKLRKLRWPEDALRKRFYQEHPWELARPRILSENDGQDFVYCDWSRMDQPRKGLDGESVVQRTLWLMEHKTMTQEDAYNKALQEFYNLRANEEIEQRVALDQAQALGALLTKDDLELGFELDQAAANDWKQKATERTRLLHDKFVDPTHT
ncbi:ribosomal protein subunit Rsm25 [Schizosaccharomyces japonicus yFS275]|uniref:37S ribosomal protein S25, mitochondrial n=1 Tax=Schizosaccharomyces japonicus (strain yFS275 / FY16936) TaxID=402676 RepID=B6K6P1_SCHJY|nr:ribosomal protein subunit Rsm25 [Schizosaccharomyces japonicus yFS275]EEB09195.2 ribosomal protein subunit Rsm25 [Schizosaccharomyces japonicus yFS275]